MHLRQARLTKEQHNRVVTLCGGHPDLVLALNSAGAFQPATEDQVDAARAAHQCEEVEIDDVAGISDPEDGTGYWVQAWVWVETPEGEDE